LGLLPCSNYFSKLVLCFFLFCRLFISNLLNKYKTFFIHGNKIPKFSQVLSEDPTTRRIWYSIGTAHDLESHDDVTEALYQKIFASHFGHLAIIFSWTAGNLFHVAW
jgi:hypothetical protein